MIPLPENCWGMWLLEKFLPQNKSRIQVGKLFKGQQLPCQREISSSSCHKWMDEICAKGKTMTILSHFSLSLCYIMDSVISTYLSKILLYSCRIILVSIVRVGKVLCFHSPRCKSYHSTMVHFHSFLKKPTIHT